MLLEEEKVDSKIVLPETSKKDKSLTVGFKIVAIGPGYIHQCGKFIKPDVKVGDLVLLDAPMVARFKYKKQKYIAAKFSNVAFVIEKGDGEKEEPSIEIPERI